MDGMAKQERALSRWRGMFVQARWEPRAEEESLSKVAGEDAKLCPRSVVAALTSPSLAPKGTA